MGEGIQLHCEDCGNRQPFLIGAGIHASMHYLGRCKDCGEIVSITKKGHCPYCGGHVERISNWREAIELGILRCPRCGGWLTSDYTLNWD